jgi:hypothetical protein
LSKRDTDKDTLHDATHDGFMTSWRSLERDETQLWLANLPDMLAATISTNSDVGDQSKPMN